MSDTRSTSKELVHHNREQLNIKNEPEEESVNHECTEGNAKPDFLNTATETEYNNKVIYIKEELKIEIEELADTNDEVNGAYATVVNDGVELKCEYTNESENFCNQELEIEYESVNKIKSEVVKSTNACEVTKGVHRRSKRPLPGLKNNTQHCYEQLTDKGPSTKYKENVTRSPTKKDNQLEDGNNSVEISSSKSANIVDPGFKNLQISDTINTSEIISVTTVDVEFSKRLFVCDICDKSYQKKSSLIRHIKGHMNSFKCTFCSFETYEKSSFRRHVNTRHTKNTVYNCIYCTYKSNDKSCLTRHVNAKHTKMNFYICPYCDYKTYGKCDLNKHVNGKHTKNTVYNCSYCQYKAYDKSTLNSHVNTKHTKINVYNCSYCEYKAYEKRSLEGHVNAKHTKSTVYDCSYCSFKTYTKSILTGHVNAKHTKNTVHNCSYCSYQTYVKSSLSRHVNSKHTKNTVYNCSYCSYKTYIKSCLSKHVDRKHTKNTVKVCDKSKLTSR